MILCVKLASKEFYIRALAIIFNVQNTYENIEWVITNVFSATRCVQKGNTHFVHMQTCPDGKYVFPASKIYVSFLKEYFLTLGEYFFQKAGSFDSTIRGSNYLILVLHL